MKTLNVTRRAILLPIIALTILISSCNRDNDDTSVVDFTEAPDASILSTGEVEIITENTVRYHVLRFNSLITVTVVETETGAIIVDLGQVPSEGADLRKYVNALNKPISVVITHPHSDHYANISNFTDLPVYAHSATASVLMKEKEFTDDYSDAVNAVNSTQSIEGMEFSFGVVSNAEASENGYLTIPSVKALFVGDLLYNRIHNYIREYTPLDDIDELDNWMNGLNELKADYGMYSHVFVGHIGSRADVSTLIDENVAYLSDAQALIKGTKTLSSGEVATTVQEVVEELQRLYSHYQPGAEVLALPDAFFPGDPGASWFN